MAIHFLTRITFLIPYTEVGGAKNIVEQIAVLWGKLLLSEGLRINAEQVGATFQTPTIFCKTKDRSALGHMNDFKHQVDVMSYMGQSVEKVAVDLNRTYINYRVRMDSPLDYLRDLSKE